MANEFITNEDTNVLQKLIREIVSDPSTYMGQKYIPSVDLPVRTIFTEVIEATGGLTQEHAIGTDVKYVDSFGTHVQEFEAPAWREAIHFDEAKILYLRQLGQNDRSKKGIRQYIDECVNKLNRRLEARMEKLRWDAILSGSFTYFNKTFSYGIPSGNRVLPIGANWSLDGGATANNSAQPLVDLRYWIMGGSSTYRKYKIKKMVMNPNTARLILDNTNVQSLVKTYFSAENFGAYDLNKSLQMMIPGLPEAVVYDGWYQTESKDATTGRISVSDAVYFIPDGYIFFEANLPNDDKIGEFVQGINIQTGTIEEPGVGKYLIVDDNLAPGTKGGPSNPFMDLIAGVNGGVKLDRSFDVLTAKVF